MTKSITMFDLGLDNAKQEKRTSSGFYSIGELLPKRVKELFARRNKYRQMLASITIADMQQNMIYLSGVYGLDSMLVDDINGRIGQ